VDFDQYVAARHGRLVEHAVSLGCAEAEAAAYVDQVLLDQRRAIGRSDDPDPLVHDALERAITGRRQRPAWVGPAVALGLVAAGVAVVSTITSGPSPRPMPSLFALNGRQAQQLLEQQGFDVTLRPVRACEPVGVVHGSDPPPGQPVTPGGAVTVYYATSPGPGCRGRASIRSEAWRFVGFALGGPPPAFATTVTVVVDGSDPRRLDHVAAVDSARWGDLMPTIAAAARATAPTESGMPRLSARAGTVASQLCGVPRPDGTQGRSVLRIEVDPRAEGDASGCPLTIDLYRSSSDAIDGVVVYTPKELGQRS
jgi:hypothetical protein